MPDKPMDLDPFIKDPVYAQIGNHPELHISVKTQDSITFTSDHPFQITKIKRLSNNADESPFFRPVPFDSEKPAPGSSKHHTRSGRARPGTEGTEYKVHFKPEGGSEIDPHLIVDP